MLKSKLNQLRASEGFTIIEVIIVLVIAAVIMLMVFLVVPQLQRSQRNSRRQNDARRIAAAAEQFAANNNGVFPTAATCTTNMGAPAAPATPPCAPIVNITGAVNAPGGAAYTINNDAAPANGNAISYTVAGTCTNNAPTAYTGGTQRFWAVLLETATGTTAWCITN